MVLSAIPEHVDSRTNYSTSCNKNLIQTEQFNLNIQLLKKSKHFYPSEISIFFEYQCV